MGRAIGFISIIIVAAIGFWIYTKQGSSASPGGNAAASPRATIDLVGVKNDLNAIAQAERRHYASDGKYVSLDDLRSNGDISMQGSGRGPYTYSVETSDTGFRVIATLTGAAEGVPRSISVDETMQMKQE
ncbi:MAG TPA: hypothetical protein VFA60_07125 [Terriglobales bacterium]|nr:hypothetical protein [Terriglobales bacterium]